MIEDSNTTNDFINISLTEENIKKLNDIYKREHSYVSNKIKIYQIIKRFFDILGSFVAIFFLIPFFIVISLVIKLEQKGSIIFSQERIGKNGKLFKIYKFRSMKKGVPNISDRDFKDSTKYMTKFGEFMRKTSIDELPQLYNILKGEMSFVGPRPFILNEGYINILRAKSGVHTITPGLTGWSQVSNRNTDNHEEKLELDLYYLKNRNLGLDIKILVKTLFTTVGR